MIRGRSAAVIAAALTAGAVVVAGCSLFPDSTEPVAVDQSDCDREDLARFERDCGYWLADGTFVTWYWVSRSGTSTAPLGWVARLPRGGSWSRPSGKSVKTSRQARPSVLVGPATTTTTTTRTRTATKPTTTTKTTTTTTRTRAGRTQ